MGLPNLLIKNKPQEMHESSMQFNHLQFSTQELHQWAQLVLSAIRGSSSTKERLRALGLRRRVPRVKHFPGQLMVVEVRSKSLQQMGGVGDVTDCVQA